MKFVIIILTGVFALIGCERSTMPEGEGEKPVYYSIRSVFSVEAGSTFPDSLADPYPNPYNHQLGDSSILISFTLRDSADVKLIIQNPIGDSVVVFMDEKLPPGAHSGRWTPLNRSAVPLRSGLYFITLRADPDDRNYIDSKLLYIENND